MRPERAYSPAARGSEAPDPDRVLVIGCGALARELVAVIDQAGLTNVDLTCLPATLHNRPGGIPALVREKIRAARPRYEQHLRRLRRLRDRRPARRRCSAEEGVERLPGAHCYEFYAGAGGLRGDRRRGARDVLPDRLPGPQLRPAGHQGPRSRPPSRAAARPTSATTPDSSTSPRPTIRHWSRRPVAARRRLGLTFEVRRTGFGDLATSIVAAADPTPAGAPTRPQQEPPDMPPMLSTIWWRDIPAQVVAKDARARARSSSIRASRSPSTRPPTGPGCASTTPTSGSGARRSSHAATTSRPSSRPKSERLEAEYTKHHLAELIQSGGIAGGPALPPATTAETSAS